MTTLNNTPLLKKLCNKGDQINIINGRLSLLPLSKKEIPPSWLKQNENILISEIAELFSIDIYIYDRYSTGFYGKHKSEGVTLQFFNLATGQEAFMIFNAQLLRARSTSKHKAGERLPKGQFRVSKNMGFYKWWLTTKLKQPPRLSSFHCYMGNLKQLFFTADIDRKGQVIDKKTALLNIRHKDIVASIQGLNKNNSHTVSIQNTDNTHTAITYKESTASPEYKGAQVDITTGKNNHGKRLYGSEVISNTLHIDKQIVNPKEQSHEEWLNSWDNA